MTCHGEAFNPAFIGKKDQGEMFGVRLAACEVDPFVLLHKLRGKTEGMADLAIDGLADISDAEVEAAARDAYGRDCMGFGFGDWRT